MSTNHKKLDGQVSARSIVIQVLNTFEDYDRQNYMWAMQELIDLVTDMQMFISTVVDVDKLEMDTMGVVVAPSDMVAWSKVGYLVNGKVHHLISNRNLGLIIDESCGQLINDNPPGMGADTSTGTAGIIYADGTSALYGYRANPGAYFREVKDPNGRNYFIFGGSIPQTTIYLEYVSSGISAEKPSYVARAAKKMLVAALEYRYARHKDKTATETKIRNLKEDYYEEREAYEIFANSYTIEELRDFAFSISTQSIGR